MIKVWGFPLSLNCEVFSSCLRAWLVLLLSDSELHSPDWLLAIPAAKQESGNAVWFSGWKNIT